MRDITLSVEERAIDSLKPYRQNARTHSRKQVKQIARSIEEFGFCNPVLIADDGEIIAGHGRVMAAQLLGLATVPCLRLSHLSSKQRRAYIIADNELAQKAGWDQDILAKELQFLLEDGMRLALAVGQQVLDLRPAFGEPPRHQHGAMAVERLLLGAHQAERGVGRARDQAIERLLELGSPGQRIVACAVLGFPAQGRALVAVKDASRGQGLRQPLAAELREAARVGRRAHIDHRLDAARLQEVDEAADRMVGMTDRFDHAPIK